MENEEKKDLNTAPPPVPQQPVVEPAKPSILSSKLLKIGIGTLLVIIVLSGTFILGKNSMNKNQAATTVTKTSTSTPTPTASAFSTIIASTQKFTDLNNGKIEYQNSQYNFTFEFPSTWNVQPVNENDPSNSGYFFTIYDDSKTGAKLEMLKGYTMNGDNCFNSKDAKKINILLEDGGIPAVRTDCTSGDYSGIYFTFLRGHDPLILAATWLTEGTKASFEDVLASLKFTDSTDETANWKSYISPKGKFSISYPSNWVQPNNKQVPCEKGLFDRALYLGPNQYSVLACGTSFGGQMSVWSDDGDKRNGSISDNYNITNGLSDIKKENVIVDGVSGQRIEGIFSGGDYGGPRDGTKKVIYIFYTYNRTYRANYYQAPSGSGSGDPLSEDVLLDFESMVKTLKFIP